MESIGQGRRRDVWVPGPGLGRLAGKKDQGPILIPSPEAFHGSPAKGAIPIVEDGVRHVDSICEMNGIPEILHGSNLTECGLVCGTRPRRTCLEGEPPPGRSPCQSGTDYVPVHPSTTIPARYQELRRRLGVDRVLTNVPLAPFTTFRIGGPADLLYQARTPDELAEALLAARELAVPVFLLGHGANILVADSGFRGLIVRCEVEGIEFLGEDRVRVGSGVAVFPDLIEETVSAGLGGLHHFVGIPGTVGGAIWQNLHFLSPAPERDRTVFLEEVVLGAEILSEDGRRREVDAGYFRFGYDFSVLHERDDAVLSVTFGLAPTRERDMRRTMHENLAWRRERHPDLAALPSAGSVFKKVEGTGAGRLIDECGLKGLQYGGAQIFSRHANIIVNRGGATASDVLHLMDTAVASVERETGHRLIPEISLVGDFETDLPWISQDAQRKTT